MPHWFAPYMHGGSSTSQPTTAGPISGTSSATSSAPPSRPGSPTLRAAGSRTVSGARVPPGLNLAGSRTASLQGGDDPLAEIYGSRPTTPAYNSEAFPATPTTVASSIGSSYVPSARGAPMTPSLSSSGVDRYPHGNHHHAPLEINLDTDLIILRGAGGDVNPALLTGQVVLNLTESTNIKELTLRLEGKAKVAFFDAAGASGSKNHHFTHHFLTRDWSFLQGNKSHSHTLKAGRHVFNFDFTFEGNIPASLRTYLNDANISYKLRASAIRSAFSSNFHAQKNVTVVRSFTNEALEYNQTLEIENTWPGKVMYCLTLPFKAYAAGDEIPVNVKFMPLAKGVKVTSVSSVIKEYTQVHTRNSSHNEVRVAASTKHEIKNGRAYRVTEAGVQPAAPPHHYYSEDSIPPGSAAPSAPPSPHHRPVRDFSLGGVTPMTDSGLNSRATSYANLAGAGSSRANDGYFGHPGSGPGSGNATPGPSHPTVSDFPDDMRNPEEDDINVGDDEVDTMITIPIPSWTTPSHSIHPVYVTHKIKWSCAISNPDGHVSELRCALPIHILPHAVLEEAQTASAGTRALLFGGQAEETTQVDLPSYNDHVYDRVANAALGPTTSYVASGNRTPHSGTPPVSRGPSRPGSPVLRAQRDSEGHEHANDSHMSDDIPPRPQLNWADSELLLSLGGLATANNSAPASALPSPHATPPESRTPSRPGSRLGFRSGRSSGSGSRAGSRASSPERAPNTTAMQGGSLANGTASVMSPAMERRTSHGIPSLFHLPAGIKPLTSFVRNANKSQPVSGSNSVDHSPAGSPTLRPTMEGRLPRSSFSLGSHAAFTSLAEGSGAQHGHAHATTPPVTAPTLDPLSQVPSYAVAREWLGGGVVPTSALPPTYDDSERMLDRARSEGDLVLLGQQAEEANSLAARLAQLSASSVHHTGEDGPGPDGARASHV
ncbi:hypothetical protein QFC22_001400 [Naganishia vaughanmartiniae]|uniref:Uncharacterized protein n=1 Tax=Naganishia vaughanmartiniae TaxID=1424756 RepID=A0ACC2XIW2_9TREE|nr:hypothetical protein QFC22_001400 [Naganishia vaughanmartiniae]